jgi:hypothetical protein
MWSVESRVGARVQAGEGAESRMKWDSSGCLGASEGVGPRMRRRPRSVVMTDRIDGSERSRVHCQSSFVSMVLF